MRLLALPVVRVAAVVAAAVFGAAVLAGALRLLPLLFAPGVSGAALPVLVRGAIAMAAEVALFVAPPVAWALVCARLVDRGDAAALASVGARPLAVVAAGWPAAAILAVAGAASSATWARDAAAPGRVVEALVTDAKRACADGDGDASRPRAAAVPIA
ncbi:MAG TPA: hypothetical protein VHB21_03230, partial [Minicystis sp.]|nr:hypothetical protein [Minicystis sp.]